MQTSGLVESDCDYLKAKNLYDIRRLAKVAVSEVDCQTRIIEPYIAGVKIGETIHKYDGDRDAIIST